MSATRSGRLRRATALVPLALLSAAATASLLGVGSPLASAGDRSQPTLPDGTTVPSQAIQAPASVTTGDSLGLGVGNANAEQIISTASTSGIPSAALAAYQRAATVIDAADTSCHLSWQLIAAIGRVESNHGRAGGSTLSDSGVATPAIFGVPLDGTGGTQSVADSDAGQYDDDKTTDRAVGPMQFLPSTWSVVGVDADGDGVRNPQDINDAALGTAVYLCSGSDDLGTTTGQQAAVYRYNHSQSYVDLVLAIAQAYANGDFTTIPNGTVMAGEITRYQGPTSFPTPSTSPDSHVVHHGPSQTTSAYPTPTASASPTASAKPTPSATASASPTSKPSSKPSSKPTTSLPSTSVSIPPLPSTSITPVDQALTLVQATAQCTLDGLNQLLNPAAFNACVDHYMHPNG